MNDMQTLMREQARLIILKELAQQPRESLNSDLMIAPLATFGIWVDRGWVHDEYAWLADRGAIVVTQAGSLLVATLTEKGHRHLRREIAMDGVKRPSRPGE
jgi:hypothetical protein